MRPFVSRLPQNRSSFKGHMLFSTIITKVPGELRDFFKGTTNVDLESVDNLLQEQGTDSDIARFVRDIEQCKRQKYFPAFIKDTPTKTSEVNNFAKFVNVVCDPDWKLNIDRRTYKKGEQYYISPHIDGLVRGAYTEASIFVGINANGNAETAFFNSERLYENLYKNIGSTELMTLLQLKMYKYPTIQDLMKKDYSDEYKSFLQKSQSNQSNQEYMRILEVTEDDKIRFNFSQNLKSEISFSPKTDVQTKEDAKVAMYYLTRVLHNMYQAGEVEKFNLTTGNSIMTFAQPHKVETIDGATAAKRVVDVCTLDSKRGR